LLSAALAAGVAVVLSFLLRAPVVVLVDTAFLTLYGPSAATRQSLLAAVRLWRPVRLAELAENADPGTVAAKVEARASRPYCTVFPERYRQAAREYARRRPGVTTIVFGTGTESAENIRVLGTDTAADLYRAGLAAALVCGATGGNPAWLGGQGASPDEQAAFIEGVQAAGYGGTPLLLAAAAAVPESAGSVVLSRSAAEAPASSAIQPLIVFSWLAPALLPGGTVLRFDDSPLALLVPAVRAAAAVSGPLLLPSVPHLIRTRGREAPYLRELGAGLKRFGDRYPERNNKSL